MGMEDVWVTSQPHVGVSLDVSDSSIRWATTEPPPDGAVVQALYNGPHSALFAFQVLITLGILLLNSTALGVTIFARMYKKTMWIYIISLTVSDLALGLVLLLSLPGAFYKRWPLGEPLCQVVAVASLYFQMCSLGGLTLLCVDRLLAITKPYWYNANLTPFRALILCVVNWLVALVIIVLDTIFAEDIGFLEILSICIVHVEPKPGHGYDEKLLGRKFARMIILGACVVVIIYSTIRVALAARRHARQIQNQDRGSFGKPQEAIIETSILRSHWSVVYMGLSLLLTTPPVFILLAVFPRWPHTDEVTTAVYWLMYTNSVWNTVIYSYRTRQFRRAMRRLWNKLRGRVAAEEANNVTTDFENTNGKMSTVKEGSKEQGKTQKPDIFLVSNHA